MGQLNFYFALEMKPEVISYSDITHRNASLSKGSNEYLPFSELALPPLVAAASKDVPRTENTFTLSSHFTVHNAFPETQILL